jgi:hypothetical protein
MTKLTIPTTLANTMASVRSVLPSAFLAGGALRDLDNGRPVKDYDVFFTDDYNMSALDDVLAGTYEYYRQCPGAYLDGAANEVNGTFTYNSVEGLPQLNFIQLDKSFNPASIIERVDFGLCQIGGDVLGITKTEAYDYDKTNQCFTLTRAETVEGVKRSLRRYMRLKEKYAWPLFWRPEHNQLVHEAMDALEAEGVFPLG